MTTGIPIRKIGSKGKIVKILQEKLNAQLNANLEVDGLYGEATRKAIRQLQKERNKRIDGVAGPEVFEMLGIEIELNPERNKVESHQWQPSRPFEPKILIMKGGGVKGIAYVGALEILENYGYEFDHFVGTSAGAISASFLSAGYTTKQLGDVLAKTNFKHFMDGNLLFSLLLFPFRKGLFKGDEFKVWMETNLRSKFPGKQNYSSVKFSDLTKKSRLTIFTSVKGKSAYPFDSKDPVNKNRDISFACRCSMALPYFFLPEKIDGQTAIDGGSQNNYPVYALLKVFEENQERKSDFLGIYLGNKGVQYPTKWFFSDLFSILTEGKDEEAKEIFLDRTIIIDPNPIKTTDFSLTPKEIEFLLAEGRASTLYWLHYWADGKHPSAEELADAQKIANSLRNEIIEERKQRSRSRIRLLLGILTFSLILVFLAYFLYPQASIPTNLPVKQIGEETLEPIYQNSFYTLYNDAVQLQQNDSNIRFATVAIQVTVAEPTGGFTWNLSALPEDSQITGVIYKKGIQKVQDLPVKDKDQTLYITVPKCEKGDELIAIVRVLWQKNSSEEPRIENVTQLIKSEFEK